MAPPTIVSVASRGTLRLALACALAAMLALPASAPAASVTGYKKSGKSVFRAGGGEKNRLIIYRDKRDRFLFKDRSTPLKARGRCKRLDKHFVRCPRMKRRIGVRLGSRNDRLNATADARFRVRGGGGRDKILGGPRADNIHGQRQNDNVSGRGGDDSVKGGYHKDEIYGGRGDDRLYGNLGRDHLQGRGNDDYLNGGDDADRLHGGTGEDRLRGGGGNDRFIDDKYLKDFAGIDSQITFQHAFNNDMNAMAVNLSAQAATGIKIHRQVFSWRTIETSPGRYDFGVTDRYMLKMAAHGMRVLPVLFDAPRWHAAKGAQPDKGIHAKPKSGRALGRFGRALIARYGPKGSFWRHPWLRDKPEWRERSAIQAWQIWNEPNLRQYWSGKANAKQYVRMLKAAEKEMRKAPGGRSAEIVSAGIPQSNIRGAIPLKKYIPAMYKAGLKRAANTFGFNAYANNTKDLERKIKQVRGWMNKAGDRSKRIWITEIGWASAGKRHRLRKGLSGQAREIKRAIALLGKQRKRQKIRGFIYYRWRDARPYREGIDAGTWGFHAGLLRINGEFKPAQRAYRTAVGKLGPS